MRWIFVGGCPRSGTTLVGSLVGASPGFVIVPESQFKRELVLRNDFSLSASRTNIERSLPFRIWDLGERYFESVSPSIDLRQLLDHMARTFAARHAHWGVPHTVVDHTPSNLRPDVAVSLARLFPDALFVHVVRDPRGVVNSIRRCDWGPTGIRASAEWWLDWIGSTSSATANLQASAITVRFEDVLQDPAGAVSVLASYARGFGEGSTGPTDDYRNWQVDGSRGRAWRAELPRFGQDEVARLTGSVARSLGYAIDEPSRRPMGDRVSLLGDTIVSGIRSRTVNRLRYSRRKAGVERSLVGGSLDRK